MRERILTVSLFMSLACGGPPVSAAPTTPPTEQLTCGDSTAPIAYYARAASLSMADTASGLAIRIQRGNPPIPVQAADLQVWGPRSAGGSPGDASGTTVFRERDPGLHSLRLRVTPERRWIYAVTLRPGYLDTVVVNLDTRCTSIWRR